MSPALQPAGEAERLEALRQYHLPDTLPEQALDDLTTLAALICDAPVSLISLVDEKRQWFTSKAGLSLGDTPREISFCRHVVTQSDLFIVPDAAQDERFADNPLVTGDPHIRFYAGAPLVTADGHALGALCVMDRVPRQLTSSQQDALRILSRQAMALLEVRRQTRALVESEARLHIVTDNARMGLVIVNLDRRYVYANSTYAEILDLPSPAIVGQRVADVLTGSYEEQIRPQLDRAFAGERVAYELRKPTADGDAYYSVRYEPTRVDGSVALVVVVITDISEGKQAQAARRASEERYRTLFENAPDGIVIADRESYYIDANPSMCRMLGYSRDEFIGLHASDIVAPVEVAHIGSALRTIEARSDYQREWQFRRKDGSVFQADVIATTIPDGNLLGMVRDITDRRAAEDEVRRLNAELEQRVIARTAQLEAANAGLRDSRAEINSLFESLPGSYVVLTPDLTIVAVSDAYLKSTLTTREGLVGRGLFDMFPENPNDSERHSIVHTRASMDRVLQNGAPDVMAIQKHDVRRPDGVFEERYWSPINSPVFGADRQIKYIVHRVEDVTEFMRHKTRAPGSSAELSVRVEQMEAEIFANSQQLQTANRLLDTANKELESFSYSVSHDLRAPLRAVNGFAGIVLEDFGDQLPAEGRRYLERIRKGGEQMGRLIDDLLAFSRLSRESMSRRTVDTARLVRAALDELKPQCEGRQIEITIGDLPPCYGDPALLKQVWLNLLSNAVKYSRGRTPAVVEIGCGREHGQDVYFVRDNGAGFDMAYAHKLFGVFQRLHRTDEFEGTGVGLAIVQRVVHRHGGRVWAEAEEGRGATFHFTLAEGTA